MTKIVAALFAVGLSVAALSSAHASGGCGWGWHWSNRWGHCVRNGGPAVVVAVPGVGFVAGAPVRRGCGYGWHWSPRWGHCVRNW